MSSNFGTATFSLDFSTTLNWPNTKAKAQRRTAIRRHCDHLSCDHRLGLKSNSLGHGCSAPTRGIIRPCFRRIEAPIDQRLAEPACLGDEHTDLVVLHPPRRAGKLPCNADQWVPLLRNPVLSTTRTPPASPSVSSTPDRTTPRTLSACQAPRPSKDCSRQGRSSPACPASCHLVLRATPDDTPSMMAPAERRNLAQPNAWSRWSLSTLSSSSHANNEPDHGATSAPFPWIARRSGSNLKRKCN